MRATTFPSIFHRFFTFSPNCRRFLRTPKIFLGRQFAVLANSRFNHNFLTLNFPYKTTQNLTFKSITTMSGKLEDIADVEIDHGRFKYILIKIYENTPTGEEKAKYIVRGYNWAAYHADIFEHVDKKVKEAGLDAECVGGGRILHDLDKKCLSVYGYSTGYGKADHEITTGILKQKYPDYGNISWSNEGY